MKLFRLTLLSAVLLSFGSCSLNHAKIDNDLKKHFDSSNVEGCFALLNNQMGNITVYNMKLDTQRLSTGTSFKIPETLIGIQTGKITNENTTLEGDYIRAGKSNFERSFCQFIDSLFSIFGERNRQRHFEILA